MSQDLLLILLAATLGICLLAVATLVAERAFRVDAVDDDRSSSRSVPRRRVLVTLDGRFVRTAWGSRVHNLLHGAGLGSWSALVLVVAVMALCATTFQLVSATLGLFTGLIAAGLLPFIVRWYLERRRERRVTRFIAQLPELARLLSNGTTAGLSVQRSLELAAGELDNPAAEEVAQLGLEMSLGRSLREAMESLMLRLPSRDLSVLAQTILIQARSGGALASSLLAIASTLDDRRQLEREARTVTTGSRFSGYVVIFIGAGSLLIMNLVAPGALDEMLLNPIGQVVVVVAGTLFVLGYYIINLMAKVDR